MLISREIRIAFETSNNMYRIFNQRKYETTEIKWGWKHWNEIYCCAIAIAVVVLSNPVGYDIYLLFVIYIYFFIFVLIKQYLRTYTYMHTYIHTYVKYTYVYMVCIGALARIFRKWSTNNTSNHGMAAPE